MTAPGAMVHPRRVPPPHIRTAAIRHGAVLRPRRIKSPNPKRGQLVGTADYLALA